MVYDSLDELIQARRDQRSGRLLREALDALDADREAVWAKPEYAVMFARYAQARRAQGAKAGERL